MRNKNLDSFINRNATQKRPMYDDEVHNFHATITSDMSNDPNHIINLFKIKIHKWLLSHKRITFNGLEKFQDRNICLGVTHQLDEVHLMNKNVVIFDGEYQYHKRLFPNITTRTIETLTTGDTLIISAPFTSYDFGIHPLMPDILSKCLELKIPIHIDAAWYPCCRDIDFNIDHPAIKTVTFSLSKAFGLGMHRIGLRYSRKPINGPIKIMNDFNYTNIADVWIGLKFIEKFGTDFWWNKYENCYNEIIQDCNNLKPSKAIHVALTADGKSVPTRQALLFLFNK